MDSFQQNNPHKPARPPDATAFDLLLALREQDVCPVCHMVRRMVGKYLEWVAYESVTDPQTRERLRGSLGYCAAHGQEWLAQRDVLGTALIYEDIFAQVVKILDAQLSSGISPKGGFVNGLRNLFGSGKRGTDAGAELADALAPKEACPACAWLLDVEQRLVRSCAGAFDNAEFMAEFTRHKVGLCFPHLRSVVRQVGSEATLRDIMLAYRAILEKTRGELEEVARKNDHRYMAEQRGEEFSAPARSVGQAGGLLPTQLNMPK